MASPEHLRREWVPGNWPGPEAAPWPQPATTSGASNQYAQGNLSTPTRSAPAAILQRAQTLLHNAYQLQKLYDSLPAVLGPEANDALLRMLDESTF